MSARGSHFHMHRSNCIRIHVVNESKIQLQSNKRIKDGLKDNQGRKTVDDCIGSIAKYMLAMVTTICFVYKNKIMKSM